MPLLLSFRMTTVTGNNPLTESHRELNWVAAVQQTDDEIETQNKKENRIQFVMDLNVCKYTETCRCEYHQREKKYHFNGKFSSCVCFPVVIFPFHSHSGHAKFSQRGGNGATMRQSDKSGKEREWRWVKEKEGERGRLKKIRTSLSEWKANK